MKNTTRVHQGTGTSPMPEDIRAYDAFKAMNVFKNETLKAGLNLSEHGSYQLEALRRELKVNHARLPMVSRLRYG